MTFIQKECRTGMSLQYHDTPEDQPVTHNVATNVLVPRHSFKRSIVVHQEDSVMIYLEDTILEGKVVIIKIMSR